MSDWWKSFFIGPWKSFYRHYGDADRDAQAAAAICSLLGLEANSTVLDAPCGSGRIAIELAALGHAVTGLDITAEYLDDARRAAAQRGVSVQWIEGDMREPPRGDGFDAVVCYWSSFGYFDDDGNMEHARAMCQALKPGGTLLLDTVALETMATRFQPSGVSRVADVTAVEERSYDALTGRMRVVWTFYGPEKKLGSHRSDMRLFSAPELIALLRHAGFVDIQGYGALDGSPFEIGSGRLVLVATRGS